MSICNASNSSSAKRCIASGPCRAPASRSRVDSVDAARPDVALPADVTRWRGRKRGPVGRARRTGARCSPWRRGVVPHAAWPHAPECGRRAMPGEGLRWRSMFPSTQTAKVMAIGRRIGDGDHLEAHGIYRVSELLFGDRHRQIAFDVEIGHVCSRQLRADVTWHRRRRAAFARSATCACAPCP